MEKKEIKSEELQPKDILKKWILIALAIYLPSTFIIVRLIKFFAKANIYGIYYQSAASDILSVLCFLVFLVGLFTSEWIYFRSHKKNKTILIILLVFIIGITCKVVPYSEMYEDYKDLHYVTEGTYCEEVQDLKNVYINVQTGKYSSKTLYVETSNIKFIVNDNIVDEENYDRFKEKFNNVKKVKIRYLPNSGTLLSIEPMT